MPDIEAKRSHVRIAAAILAAILLAATVFTYLSYTAAFTSTDTVTVTSPRAGLVMESDAKVKYRGIQVGEVKSIEYAGNQAKLTLAINSDEMRYIPANAVVHIAGTTVFGAKSVEFVPPEQPSGQLRAGANVEAKDVQLEVNTLFQTLTDVLHKIDPINLNATLSALAEGLRGNGDDLGATAVGAELLSAAAESEAADAAGGPPEDRGGGQHLRRRGSRSGPHLRQRTGHQQHDRRPAGQPERHAPCRDRPGQQRHRDAGAGRKRLHRSDSAVAGAAEGRSATTRPSSAASSKGIAKAIDRLRPVIGGIRPGLFVASNFLPGCTGLHLSGKPADRERLRRTELPRTA